MNIDKLNQDWNLVRRDWNINEIASDIAECGNRFSICDICPTNFSSPDYLFSLFPRRFLCTQKRFVFSKGREIVFFSTAAEKRGISIAFPFRQSRCNLKNAQISFCASAMYLGTLKTFLISAESQVFWDFQPNLRKNSLRIFLLFFSQLGIKNADTRSHFPYGHFNAISFMLKSLFARALSISKHSKLVWFFWISSFLRFSTISSSDSTPIPKWAEISLQKPLQNALWRGPWFVKAHVGLFSKTRWKCVCVFQ